MLQDFLFFSSVSFILCFLHLDIRSVFELILYMVPGMDQSLVFCNEVPQC